jgi:hypothetical protein
MNNDTHEIEEQVFEIDSPAKFNSVAFSIFHYQMNFNPVYSNYVKLVNRNWNRITDTLQIPFLPIEFFRNNKVITGDAEEEVVFESSQSTGQSPSRHYISDKKLYEKSFSKCFEMFFGDPTQYCVLALLPSYLERKNSSLVFMADSLIRETKNPDSGFFLNDLKELSTRLQALESKGNKTILIGVAFALLDFAEEFQIPLKNTIIIETGGMKGRRKEVTRTELHSVLKKAFGVETIYSEYGMTELLSQAYSTGEGIFKPPPWMKIAIRNPYDPFELLPAGKTGGINIIDLANLNSCSFIQTDDLGKLYPDGSFEVLGRMDAAELRGCNLMAE